MQHGGTMLAVCICTAGRPRELARLLAALTIADLRPHGAVTEIVVVDNRPGTPGAVRGLPATVAGVPVHMAAEPRAGIPFARNAAVTRALADGADLVAFIDDDDLPRPDWLVRLVERQVASGADLVFGASRSATTATPPAWARELRYFAGNRLDRISTWGVPAGASTCNVLIRRRVLDTLDGSGPFRAAFAGSGGEDTDLFARAVAAGFGFAVAEDSVVERHWDARRTGPGALARRALKYGATRQRLKATLRPTSPARQRRAALRRTLKSLVTCGAGLPRPRTLPQRAAAFLEELGGLMSALGRDGGYYLGSDAQHRR